LDPGSTHRPRPGAVHGPRPALRDERHPGVAVVLLEEPPDGPGPVPGARSLHSAHEAEKHPPPPPRRRAHHPPGRRVLRLRAGGPAPPPAPPQSVGGDALPRSERVFTREARLSRAG